MSAEHDIHEDDIEFIVKEDRSDKEKEEGNLKYRMSSSTLVTELEVGIIQGWEQEFVVKMTNVKEPTSPLTNI